jgi:Ni,Fe-hydrogenase III large subunit
MYCLKPPMKEAPEGEITHSMKLNDNIKLIGSWSCKMC